MNEKLHYGSCPVWGSAAAGDCTCPAPAWRIRKDPAEQFPWRVFRQTSDGPEQLMGCSTWQHAVSLIREFDKLRANTGQLRRDSSV